MNYVYIQGNFVKAKDARIDLSNRGFKFGDGVFETIRIHNKKPYNLQFHLSRLNTGLTYLQIQIFTNDLETKLLELIKKNHLRQGFARIHIYRDSESLGYYPIENKGGIIITTSELSETESKPAELYTSDYPSGCLAKAKIMSSVGYIMAMMEARNNGCDNALILDDDEFICETASGNIFWFKNDVLHTPHEQLKFIPGSIRERILNLYKGEIAIGKFTLNDLATADEIFMSNVNYLVLPFTILKPLGRKFTIDKSLQIKQLVEDDINTLA